MPYAADSGPDIGPVPRRSAPPSRNAPLAERGPVRAAGKFFVEDGRKIFLRGVTYGPFRSDDPDQAYGTPERAARDLAQMAAHGFNTVRLYTVPPPWLLDLAGDAGLRVLVGVPWEEHVAFLDSRATRRRIVRAVGDAAARLDGHPALLGLAVGNEIPAPIVRLYGAKRIERYVAELCDAARQKNPGTLVTYVNYPTTEYLELPSCDFMAFNVYLENEPTLRAYLARLQNLAGERPLVLAELGLDSRRNGLEAQATALDWQIRATFAMGGAGVFAYAWTDEWHRGGNAVEDWDFGLTTRERAPKPALAAVSRAFAEAPFAPGGEWPRISVVVCTFNGARTIRDTLDHLARLDYPDYEVIVVNDGSRDDTGEIARGYGVRVITTENRGLSAARNTGLAAATGEIVAYTDDDAYPDRDWLRYLASAFMRSKHVGIGGPNIAPPGDGFAADCVAASPGGPVQVLLTDEIAEHIPGCNMAFRVDALRRIGGFDPRFRTAGDDVDACWRLQDQGWTIGFHAGGMVWHHRRNSLRAFWRQQIGYGRAEALLEGKWPARYNAAGHYDWRGRIYGPGLTLPLIAPSRVYHGPWGTAPFQSMYKAGPPLIAALPLMPEWYLLIAGLAALGMFAASWPPLLLAALAVPAAIAVSAVQAIASARTALAARGQNAPRGIRAVALVALLHLAQPLARLTGRLRHGLTVWRRRGTAPFAWPRPATVALWAERWQAPEARLAALERKLAETGACAVRGGAFDRWDIEVRSGILGGARVLLAPEEHGGGRQNLLFRIVPTVPRLAAGFAATSAALATLAASDGAYLAAAALGAAAAYVVVRIVHTCGLAFGEFKSALARVAAELDPAPAA
jgi:GT2 family glycosyltransferase